MPRRRGRWPIGLSYVPMVVFALLQAVDIACGASGATPIKPSPSSSPAETTTIAPAPTATPEPSALPSTQLPAFIGTLNGIPIDPSKPTGTGFDACPGTGLTSPSSSDEAERLAFGTGALQIDPSQLPTGTTRSNPPELFLCKEEVVWASAYFLLAPGTPNANPGGGVLFITRSAGFDYVRKTAPPGAWSATTIGGFPAVTARVPGPPGVSGCFTAVVDLRTGHATFVDAPSGATPLCESVALGQVAIAGP